MKNLELDGTALLVLAGLAVGGLVLWHYRGIVTGDNALTRGATNAAGEPVTAYVGAGPVGTVGAAANKVSGGWLATAGEWLGGVASEIFSPEVRAANESLKPTQPEEHYDPMGAYLGTW